MGNDAFHNMDPDTKATLYDLQAERLELEQECLNEGRWVVRLTERQLWFLKCACEARYQILPLRPGQLDPKTFAADYGISQGEMYTEVERLSIKLKAT